MKKFLALILALLLCGTALAEVVAPQIDETYVEVEDSVPAMNDAEVDFAFPSPVSYDAAKGIITIWLDYYVGPVNVTLDDTVKLGVINGIYFDFDAGPRSFDFKVDKPLSAGKHKVKVSCSWDSAMVEFTVAEAKPTITPKPTATPKPAAVKKVTLAKSVSVNVDETVQLSPKVSPASATTTFTYKSSKASIAKVDKNGLVTGVKEGSAKITVTTANKKKATVTVKVVDPNKPTKVTISAPAKSVDVKATLQLTAVVSPAKASQKVTWKSSNTKVAKVDQNGLVTGVKKGTAKITATAGKKKATFKVTVNKAATPKYELSVLLGRPSSYAKTYLGVSDKTLASYLLPLTDRKNHVETELFLQVKDGVVSRIATYNKSPKNYTLFGVARGDSLSTAEKTLTKGGWVFDHNEKNREDRNYEFRVYKNSRFSGGTVELEVNLYKGKVYMVDMNTFVKNPIVSAP